MKSATLSADGTVFDDSLAWRVLTVILYMSCLGFNRWLQLWDYFTVLLYY